MFWKPCNFATFMLPFGGHWKFQTALAKYVYLILYTFLIVISEGQVLSNKSHNGHHGIWLHLSERRTLVY